MSAVGDLARGAGAPDSKLDGVTRDRGCSCLPLSKFRVIATRNSCAPSRRTALSDSSTEHLPVRLGSRGGDGIHLDRRGTSRSLAAWRSAREAPVKMPGLRASARAALASQRLHGLEPGLSMLGRGAFDAADPVAGIGGLRWLKRSDGRRGTVHGVASRRALDDARPPSGVGSRGNVPAPRGRIPGTATVTSGEPSPHPRIGHERPPGARAVPAWAATWPAWLLRLGPRPCRHLKGP